MSAIGRELLVRRAGLYWLKMQGALVRGRLAALRVGSSLAPGVLFTDDCPIDNDQAYLLNVARTHGPIFKVWWHGKITTCIIGLAECRRFLRESDGNVRADTVDFSQVFSHGFLRAMEGETHQKYKQAFIAAMRSVDVSGHEATLKRLLWTHMIDLDVKAEGVAESQIAIVIKRCATAAMIRLVYGIDADSNIGARLAKAHDDYVPNGTPVVVREREKAAFSAIKSLLVGHMKSPPQQGGPVPSSLLRWFIENDRLDETAFGNLIQMVEFGRFDTHGLWRWIAHFLARNPEHLQRIRQEQSPQARRELAQMAVSETLRLEQSEAVVRIVTKAFVFNGHAFPAGTRVRLCIWESHREERYFPQAEVFRPDRFSEAMPPADHYAPLGLGHHQCLGANWTFSVGALFVECLAQWFDVQAVRNAPTVMGHFHFEPGPEEAATFQLRSGQS